MASGVASDTPHAAAVAIRIGTGERTAALPPPGPEDHWCHAVAAGDLGAEETPADITPELVQISRLTYGDAEPALPSNACLAEEPPLQNLARAGIDAR